MYFSNGFVYGSEPFDNIKVASVKVLDDLIMLITFNNGETRLFDTTTLTDDVFAPLHDPKILRQYTVEFGVPTWCDGNIDCAPEYLYEHSYEYAIEQTCI